MWFPPLVLVRCLSMLIYGAAFNQKCDFSNLLTYGNSSVFRCFMYMLGETPIMMVLTWYFEIVLATGGAARHPLFFVDDIREKFFGGKNAEVEASALLAASSSPDDEASDVKAERLRAEAGGENQAVRVLNFRKVFAPKRGQAPKIAVNDLSFAVNNKECFGLLGHNGAGKVVISVPRNTN